MHTRVQVVSIVVALLGFFVVFELVRRRRLGERQALLWLAAAFALLLLAVWQGLLTTISHAMGIYYPPTALLLIASGFAVLLLLQFSVASSKLSDQTRVLAQRVALLEAALRERDAREPSATAEAVRPGAEVGDPAEGTSAGVERQSVPSRG